MRAIFHASLCLVYLNVSAGDLKPLAPISNFHLQTISETPVAINDTFVLPVGCGHDYVTGNVLENDLFAREVPVKIGFVVAPREGTLSFGTSGKFIFRNDPGFTGEVVFRYRLVNADNPGNYSDAAVTLLVKNDHDCDRVADFMDLDDDNDGLLDIHEGDGFWDTDNDGIPDSYDIDSDNDGITDLTEWQHEGMLITLLESDENGDGWDDAFDAALGGDYYEPVDTDFDGRPDYMDVDSDNDNASDFTEAFDIDGDGVADTGILYRDSDNDGLDDAFDIVPCWTQGCNPNGSNSPLPDANNNGIRDWRDETNNMAEFPKNDFSVSGAELFIYPNPVIRNCRVIVPQETDAPEFTVRLMSLKGETLLTKTVSGFQFQLDTDHITTGNYILCVSSKSAAYSAKLLKTN